MPSGQSLPANVYTSTGLDSEVHCICCGYMLRGLADSANCPECGAAVHSSLRLLQHPTELSRGLRAVAWSYCAFFTIVVVSIPHLFYIVALVTACVRGTGLWWFVRARLLHVPVVSMRIIAMMVLLGAELLVLGVYAVCVLRGGESEWIGPALFQLLFWGWLLIISLSFLVSLGFTRMLALQFQHELVLLQIRNARMCMLAGLVLSALLVVAMYTSLSDNSHIWMLIAPHAICAAIAAGHGISAIAKIGREVADVRGSTAADHVS